MKATDMIFENWKQANNENTKLSEGQQSALDVMTKIMEENEGTDHKEILTALFEAAVDYARESEKSGFNHGVRLTASLIFGTECDM